MLQRPSDNQTLHMVKLNLGCGPSIMEGYVNIDTDPLDERVVKMNILDLDYPENSVDEIYAKDIIEHLPLEKSAKAIVHWGTLCKRGATLFIQTTNFKKIIEAYQSGVWNLKTVCYMLFAGRNWVSGESKDEDWHKSTYDLETLTKIFKMAGFKVLEYKEDTVDQSLIHNPLCHNLNISIWGQKL